MPQLKLELRRYAAPVGRVIVTLAVVAVALVAGRRLWDHYQVEPWTRDGRVRADVVQIAPDVAGLVDQVLVADNQHVRRGQPLLTVDTARYALALRQAEAALAAQKALLAQARREAARDAGLADLVAGETAEQARARVEEGEAAVAQASAARDLAALNLARTHIDAPADGVLSDLAVRAGGYVVAGKPVMALIDEGSIRVEGYFEETKLKGVAIGDPVSVRIMGDDRLLKGHIQSIAAGIEDRDRTQGPNLLPSVNPTFSWVRLAQRIPVRVLLDQPPADLRLVVGRTATVAILKPARPGRAGR